MGGKKSCVCIKKLQPDVEDREEICGVGKCRLWYDFDNNILLLFCEKSSHTLEFESCLGIFSLDFWL